MRATPYWRRYLRFLGSDPAADVEDELEFHFAMRLDDLMRRGLSESQARAQAEREFGDVRRIRSEMTEIGQRRKRRAERARGWESVRQDVRYAASTLRRSPGFTAVAALTLALGIGASSAMFTLVNSVLLRPLEYREPHRLVMLWERSPSGNDENVVSPANFFDWREQAESFTELAATYDRHLNLTGGGEAELIPARLTTANFFSLLGASAQLGRTYVPGEDAENVAVLSHRLWQRRFGGDPAVIGRTITINDQALTVVGIMPADFRSVGLQPELWAPAELDRQWPGRYLQVVGRLRPDATPERAQTEMNGIARRLEEVRPERNTRWGINLVPLHEQVTGDVRPALLVLLGAVGLLLLIACANVANLLLGRAATRRKEMAVRLSLGATRTRLVRQTLTESLLLAGLAGVLGLVLAMWGTQALVRLLPADLALPRLDEVRMDGRALGFALGVSLLTAFLFGAAPALLGSSVNLSEALREATRSTTGGRSRLRRGLVVGEVALAVVLLVGAGLLGRSLQRLLEVNTGLRTDRVLTMRVMLTGAQYAEGSAKREFVRNLLSRVAVLPGVRSAGGAIYLPLTGQKVGFTSWRADRPRAPEGQELPTDIRVIAGDYFATLGIPLLRGRAFDARDDESAPPVFVINEELARRHFPGEDPIGKRITFGDVTGEIVGLVGNVREMGPMGEPAPAIYRAYAQMPTARVTIVIRSDGDPLALASSTAAAVREIDPNQPVAEVRSMEQVASRTVTRQRLNLYLLGCFAGVALLLAGLGLYAIISYSVAQRSHEIGLRVALGARHGDVLRLILREGMSLTALGLLIGLAISLAVTRVMASLLFGIRATDPLTLVAVAAFLTAVALLASYLPGRRATRVDPMIALRAE